MAAVQRGKEARITAVASSIHTRQLIEESMMIHRDRVFTGVEDMVLLTNIDDKGIADNLSDRLKNGEIYTYIGAVLVVCNPYQWLPLYGNDTVAQYPFRQQGSVAPHIFFTAESAYRGMIQEESNQCVIVSGESGAGKTETSKQIQTYIAAVCSGDDRVDRLKEVFLKSNPVLEAFGNAKTLQNNNSSRFGKYFELKFNKLGHPKGGVITNYVLEKSRIVRPKPGERGFHIFYQLLASDYKHTLNLMSPSRYAYLNCSNCYTVDGVNDSKDFITLLAALRAVGVTEIEVESIMNVVAGILALGNINFQTAEGNESIVFILLSLI